MPGSRSQLRPFRSRNFTKELGFGICKSGTQSAATNDLFLFVLQWEYCKPETMSISFKGVSIGLFGIPLVFGLGKPLLREKTSIYLGIQPPLLCTFGQFEEKISQKWETICLLDKKTKKIIFKLWCQGSFAFLLKCCLAWAFLLSHKAAHTAPQQCQADWSAVLEAGNLKVYLLTFTRCDIHSNPPHLAGRLLTEVSEVWKLSS